MRNSYCRNADGTVTIFLRRKAGPPIETVIDGADLPVAERYPGRWVSMYAPNNRSFYVVCYGGFRLHRLIMEARDRDVVDHLNHDTLDNRRANLQITTPQVNQSHHRKKRPGLGYYPNRKSKRSPWQVKINIHGKQRYHGSYATQDEAKQVADRVFAELLLA